LCFEQHIFRPQERPEWWDDELEENCTVKRAGIILNGKFGLSWNSKRKRRQLYE